MVDFVVFQGAQDVLSFIPELLDVANGIFVGDECASDGANCFP